MPACKACGEWFAKTRESMKLCCKCEMALSRLHGYAVAVVRCRDCKYRSDRLYCRLRKNPVIVTNTDFCSYAKQKDGVVSDATD